MHLRALILAVVSAALVLVGAGLQPAHASASIDNTNIESVRAAYQQRLKPALAVSQNWTGNTASCTAGAPSPAAQKATLDAVNYYRAMGSLAPVKFDAALSAKAQQAALIMSANQRLSHYPQNDWKCMSAAGKEAAGRSNIALGGVSMGAGAGAMSLYMSDPGANNTQVGHRRWMMRPQTTTMGSGSTTNANALWVVSTPNDKSSNPNPTWVSWPSAGFFPTQIEPYGRWSLSGDSGSVRFDNATVSVTGPNGAIAVKKQPVANGIANSTLVFEVGSLPKPGRTEVHDYTVRVNGIVRNGSTVSHSYTVRLFDADAPAGSQNATAAPTPAAPTPTQTIWVQTDNAPVPTLAGYKRVAPYTLAGEHVINGRKWRTQCEPYSQTERCRTEIMATIVTQENGRFVQRAGWAFNNLTYLPGMTREAWGTNPIAVHNMNGFASGGRQWRTECDTAQTGRGACRSYMLTTVNNAKQTSSGLIVTQTSEWVFNNMVLFR